MNNINKNLRVLIIEDEKPARELLKLYLKEYSNIELVGECENGFDGAIAIRDLNPDLIFLDIQMPKLTGFEMLELIEEPPMVIFSTAYDEFALKAFEINAIDYLLKPFLPERLAKSIAKAMDNFGMATANNSKMKNVLEYVRNQYEIINRVVVKVQNRIEIILSKDIEHIEAQDDYVYIYTNIGERYIKEITMKYLESHLNPLDFVRVHRSHIIRVDRISRIIQDNSDSYSIVLKSKSEIPVSKAGYKRLKEIMGV